jgi:hypothetical protein
MIRSGGFYYCGALCNVTGWFIANLKPKALVLLL